MNNDRIKNFIDSFRTNENDVIKSLEVYAYANDVPIIRQDMKDFIRMLLGIKNPKTILEIGTAIGYSALIMHYACPSASIVTIEDYLPRIDIANTNFSKYVLKKNDLIENDFCNIKFINDTINIFHHNNITLLHADATDVLKELVNKNIKFDFIFLDAAKGQYPIWLNDIVQIMSKNAVLLADNVFKECEILESRFSIEKRDRCIHSRMRQFLFDITHHEILNSTILNIGDGISLSIKK